MCVRESDVKLNLWPYCPAGRTVVWLFSYNDTPIELEIRSLSFLQHACPSSRLHMNQKTRMTRVTCSDIHNGKFPNRNLEMGIVMSIQESENNEPAERYQVLINTPDLRTSHLINLTQPDSPSSSSFLLHYRPAHSACVPTCHQIQAAGT